MPPRSQRSGQAKETKHGTKGNRKSEQLVVAMKAGNPLTGDPVERRGCRQTESIEGKMKETPSSVLVTTKLDRTATLAKQMPDVAFTTLAHHLDLDWLREAHRRTNKRGAAGVDGISAADYAVNLEANLQSLLDHAKSGTYRVPPVRRVDIPKGDGHTRPIGIPTFEDKILQRAVAMLLEGIYEQDFLDCSYGFRPRRSAHHALETLRNGTMNMLGGWVIELDIQSFFDNLDHGHLRQILRRRIGDGVVLRLLDKWLKAGVLKAGCLSYPEAGTPQGGVISPLLANVYLHEVLDTWFEHDVKPRLERPGLLVRYADDAVMVFQREADARKVMAVLPKRLGKYGLTLHPTKTRLVAFCRPPRGSDGRGPGSFDLLGFTHYWAKSLNGKWAVLRRTAHDRFSRSLQKIKEWCRHHLHDPIAVQARGLKQKLKGHYQYFGIRGNSAAIGRFAYEVREVWKRTLSRRSQRASLSWTKMQVVLDRYPLPPARLPKRHTT